MEEDEEEDDNGIVEEDEEEEDDGVVEEDEEEDGNRRRINEGRERGCRLFGFGRK